MTLDDVMSEVQRLWPRSLPARDEAAAAAFRKGLIELCGLSANWAEVWERFLKTNPRSAPSPATIAGRGQAAVVSGHPLHHPAHQALMARAQAADHDPALLRQLQCCDVVAESPLHLEAGNDGLWTVLEKYSARHLVALGVAVLTCHGRRLRWEAGRGRVA